ncbi:transcription initiation factor TFIID subunit 2-like isoform X1 [Musa acuminata AAA Group]|uniref:transcription initiation factor TFIID subunit 2-like isoform X1 n=1 Tax=Musa acuminata AAA Group TaxID=214697 RepID=UPI0031DFF084
MAKPRKQKNEEQKPECSGAVVVHQKLCVSIDMVKRRIYGYTELKMTIPEGGHVALHADNMTITNISVDGEPADFEYFPHYQVVEEARFCSVSCSSSAANVACSMYTSSLDKEMVPNLLIACNGSVKLDLPQEKENGGNSVQDSCSQQVANGCNGHPEDKNEKLVRIDYWVDRAETGIHFVDNVLLTDNQIRRAHCWFPCLDSVSQRCPFDLEFTVDVNLVAVSNGDLHYQVLSKDDPPRKTFVYKLTTPVSAGWISLIVAPFEILSDSHINIISHICLPPSFSKLQNTVGFFHNAFSYYEDYLSTSFPFGSYKQIFIPPELTISSLSLGASLCIFGSHILFDDRVIDQTIDTRIKLAYALARQWFGVFITAHEPTDEWLLDGLAGFLTDTYIKHSLGNNEARYRRYKANFAVCKADVSGATALSSSAASSDLYGTQWIGLYGKIRSWKAISVLQMLEKQIGPDSFCKILQVIVCRAIGSTRSMRTLSTKEFRHLANKVGNLERPFLKEFFPRWVESCGCPIMRMGLSYNKRRNMIELAVVRGCTAKSSSAFNQDDENREGHPGWPGMMSVRVHELDGVYDHPVLPMAGESCQLLEIQCHSKLAAKRIQKPKKGSKADGSDDNADVVSTQDMRSGVDSPLLWIRVDPEMEYLAEIHFYQPVQMWVRKVSYKINQLEKDKDVVAQSQAISMLEMLPQLSFAVVNALNSFLNDSKAFWRVRIEAAYALAHTTSEDTDLAGLFHLIKFYKSRRFDMDTGLPRANSFHEVSEYFVLEAIPHAVALVRASDKKSPREAIEFVLQLLKYNDNNGNPYSDVYWLASLVQSIGELEFGQQGILFLSSLLKRIDQLMQFDSLMPSYNGILTISCIRTLAQMALKLSNSVPLDKVRELIEPYRNVENTSWKVRIEASRALLDLEFHSKGIDAVLSLFMKFLEEECSLRGEVKLAVHVMHICQANLESESGMQIACPTLVSLLHLLTSRKAFNNVFLRHHLFCILQILAGRSPTLYGISRTQVHASVAAETCEQVTRPASLKLKIPKPQEPLAETVKPSEALPTAETVREGDTVSNCSERRVNVIKIRVKQRSSSSKADDADHQMEYSRGGPNDAELGPCSSVSVDAPARGATEPFNISSQNNEEVSSSHDRESRMTASIGSAKLASEEKLGKELQCTADSRLDALSKDQLSLKNINVEEMVISKTACLQDLSVVRHDGEGAMPPENAEELKEKGKKDKKDRERKRRRDDKVDKKDDPEYIEKKRLKKERKRKEKELAKMQKGGDRSSSDMKISSRPSESRGSLVDSKVEPGVEIHALKNNESISETAQGSITSKFRIKIKGRNTDNS